MAATSFSFRSSMSFVGFASIIPALLALFLLFYLPSLNQNIFNNTLITNFVTSSSSSAPIRIPPASVSNSTINGTGFRKLDDPKKEKSSLERIEEGLARARAAIVEASRTKNYTWEKQDSYVPRGSIYRNPYAFHRSHIEMEKRFKVWVYREGEPPLAHGGPMNDIYSIEGQFMSEMESEKSHLMARNPDEAHAFLIPISVVNIISYIYKPLVTYKRDRLQLVVSDYVDVVAAKYPYWNRSNGADHFLLSCHDWAPDISKANPEKYKHFIRALCNANTTEGFEPQRDVSIPEINLPRGKLTPSGEKGVGPNNRTILAFFAGGAHGYIRKVLLEQWKEKDSEIQVHEYLNNKKEYFKSMAVSKYCLCPSGYEVASPRVVTALKLGCVPVIISDDYALPFSDVLDWSKFSIHIPSAEIPEIKRILEGIPHEEYVKMQKRVRKVSRHFEVNRPARPFDVIHMVLHSLWLRRLNFRLPSLIAS